MEVHIYETITKVYRVDSETLEEFKKESKDISKNGLIEYMINNYYFEDFLIDETVDECTVDSDDFKTFIEEND